MAPAALVTRVDAPNRRQNARPSSPWAFESKRQYPCPGPWQRLL